MYPTYGSELELHSVQNQPEPVQQKSIQLNVHKPNVTSKPCRCESFSLLSFYLQVERKVGGETQGVVVMPTKVRPTTGAVVVAATEGGADKQEVPRCRRRVDQAEGSCGERPAGNDGVEK